MIRMTVEFVSLGKLLDLVEYQIWYIYVLDSVHKIPLNVKDKAGLSGSNIPDNILNSTALTLTQLKLTKIHQRLPPKTPRWVIAQSL